MNLWLCFWSVRVKFGTLLHWIPVSASDMFQHIAPYLPGERTWLHTWREYSVTCCVSKAETIKRSTEPTSNEAWHEDLFLFFFFFICLIEFAEMAEEEGAPQPPPAESLCLASVTQPYPRSPKTLRKPDAAPLEYSQVCLRSLRTLCHDRDVHTAHLCMLKPSVWTSGTAVLLAGGAGEGEQVDRSSYGVSEKAPSQPQRKG